VALPKAIVTEGANTSPDVTYRVTGPAWAGLSANPTSGVITITPTKAGTMTITVVAQAGRVKSAPAKFQWKVAKATVVAQLPTSLPNVVVGKPTKVILPKAKVNGAVNTSLPVTYKVSAPVWAGLTFNPADRAITVKPTKAGKITVKVVAKAGGGASKVAKFQWTVTK
jgi:hypothetical protein